MILFCLDLSGFFLNIFSLLEIQKIRVLDRTFDLLICAGWENGVNPFPLEARESLG